jgi:class 3 adenylate cyclase/TolB-like protein/Tfp pilus assembly protein PilF
MTNSSRQLSAIMFTDIVGYTSMMGRDENLALELLRKNRSIHNPLIKKYNGHLIKEMGDGVLARFDSAYDAVKCAIEIQEAAAVDFNGQLRIGLHLGEIYIENNDIFGDGVNIASRIESLADPGGIYLSGEFQKAIQNHTDIKVRYLANVTLKNVLDTVAIYCVVKPGIAIPAKEKIQKLKQTGGEKKSLGRRFFKNPLFYLLVFALGLLLITNKYWFNVKPERTVKAIAVLPFANFTGSEKEQYFVDMMHDAVITEIARIGDFIVKSRTSTLQFRDSEYSIPEIAKILDVDAILESSVFKTGDSVLMNVQLISTRPVEDHIWAMDYARDTRHILSLYGDLAKTVAREVHVQLSPFEERLLTEKKEVDPEAYRAYLNGQFHWKKLTKEDLILAEQYFEKAINIDPNYAEAYLGLSSIGGGMAQMGLISSAEAREKGEKYLKKALELDSGLWEAHQRMAFSNIWLKWDFRNGMKEFDATLQLNPNDAMTRAYYAQALCICYRDYDQADAEGNYAIKIDPIDNLYKGLYGQTLNLCRKYDKAERIFKEVLDSDPFNAIALSNLKTTYHMQGKYAEAIEVWKMDNRKDSLALEALEAGYESRGYEGALRAFAEYSIEKSNEHYVTPWRIFTIYARANMKEEALDWLGKAYEIHDPNMPYISTDPIFDYLREEPRFQAIVEKMNFPMDQ